MNDEEFDQFVQEAHEKWDAKQDALTKSFGLGKWTDYAYDAVTGELRFKDNAGKVTVHAKTVPLGSFSSKSSTWQWAWANKSTPPAVRKEAEQLKELYKFTGMDVFKMPTIEIDESMAWELVAMCVSHLDARGSYSMPAGQDGKLRVFVAIEKIGKSQK